MTHDGQEVYDIFYWKTRFDGHTHAHPSALATEPNHVSNTLLFQLHTTIRSSLFVPFCFCLIRLSFISARVTKLRMNSDTPPNRPTHPRGQRATPGFVISAVGEF